MNESFRDAVQRQVGDPTQLPQIRDALHSEVGRAIEAMRDPAFALGAGYTVEELARRVGAYEAVAGELARAAAIVGFWGTPELGRVGAEVVGRLANAVDRSAGVNVWQALALYPALIVEYAAGLGAVAGAREAFLAPLLMSPFAWERQEWVANVAALYPGAVIDTRYGRELPNMAKRLTPLSDRLFDVLRDKMDGLVFDDPTYERVYDRFECLLGLVFADLYRGEATATWAPVGRFSWRARYGGGIWTAIGDEIANQGVHWPLLTGGAFDRSADRLRVSATAYFEHVQKVANTHF